MEKTKIGVCSYYWLTHKGGISTFMRNLVESLNKQEIWDIIVVTSDKYKSKDIINISSSKIFIPIQLFFALLRIKPDIVHIHEHAWMLVGAVLYKFFRSVKIVFSFHTQPEPTKCVSGFICGTVRNNGYNLLKKKIKNLFLVQCDYITCVSKKLLGDLIHAGVRLNTNKTQIIYGGVKNISIPEDKINGLRKRYGLDKNYPVLVMVSVLHFDYKVFGIIKLIQSTKRLKENFPEIKLLIVGDGFLRSYIEKEISELNLKDNVLITGYVDDPLTFIAAANVYCHISFKEALPLAVLEAMALGKPIVASNAGGISELIENGQTGLLVNGNPEEITEAIFKLLNDHKLSDRLGQRAKSLALTNFSWDLCADRFADLYGGKI